MRVPGAAGHQQHRLVFQLAQGTGDIQRVGHHHQARLVAQLGDHRCGGTATVDDDACMFTDTSDRRPGNRLLIQRNRLALICDQLLRHGHRTTIATQQQAVGFQCSKVLADGDFRGFETFG
ncbi:hypothetical protein D3C80_1188830 [compost metagenome]